jgi:hypothetical protein
MALSVANGSDFSKYHEVDKQFLAIIMSSTTVMEAVLIARYK